MNSAELLLSINNSREEVRVAINAKGVNVPSTVPFRLYADKIREIEGGGSVATGQGEPMSIIGPRYDIGDYNLTVVNINNGVDITKSLAFSPVEIGNSVDDNINLAKSLLLQPIAVNNAINAAPYALSFVTVTLV